MQHTLRTVAQFCAFTFSFKYLMNVTHTAGRWIRDWFAKTTNRNEQGVTQDYRIVLITFPNVDAILIRKMLLLASDVTAYDR